MASGDELGDQQDRLRAAHLRLRDLLIEMVSLTCSSLDAEITENIARKRSSRLTRRAEWERITFESIRLSLLSQRIIMNQLLGFNELTEETVKQMEDYAVRIEECNRQLKGRMPKDQ